MLVTNKRIELVERGCTTKFYTSVTFTVVFFSARHFRFLFLRCLWPLDVKNCTRLFSCFYFSILFHFIRCVYGKEDVPKELLLYDIYVMLYMYVRLNWPPNRRLLL